MAPGGGLIDLRYGQLRASATSRPIRSTSSGDSGQTEFYLPWVSALSGDFIITNNPNLSVIDMRTTSVTVASGGDT